MPAQHLECIGCGEKYSPGANYNCPRCGSILDVKYEYDSIAEQIDLRNARLRNRSLWAYKELLPVDNVSNVVSLEEGGTPLHRCSKLEEVLGLKNLYVKDETRNPTGSFKDRPMTIAVTKAREFKANVLISSSSGNAGVSLAAYAAKGGLNSLVFAPVNTPNTKLALIDAYGSRLVLVNGTYSDAFLLSKRASEHYGWFNATSTFINPYQVEGDKTVAYEIWEDMGCTVPDWIFVPISDGPLLVGCLKGFMEFNLLGYATKLPHMVGIQPEGCAAIARAFKENSDDVKSWEKPSTVVSSLADPLVGYSQDGTYTLKKIRESFGVADTCTDDQTLDSVRLLARKEGIFAEPAGAISIAGLKKLVEKGKIDSDEVVVCLVTGSGLKETNFSDAFKRPAAITPNFSEFEQLADQILSK